MGSRGAGEGIDGRLGILCVALALEAWEEEKSGLAEHSCPMTYTQVIMHDEYLLSIFLAVYGLKNLRSPAYVMRLVCNYYCTRIHVLHKFQP